MLERRRDVWDAFSRGAAGRGAPNRLPSGSALRLPGLSEVGDPRQNRKSRNDDQALHPICLQEYSAAAARRGGGAGVGEPGAGALLPGARPSPFGSGAAPGLARDGPAVAGQRRPDVALFRAGGQTGLGGAAAGRFAEQFRRAATPVLCAVGGMAAPAAIYLALAALTGRWTDLRQGWAVPCATDIAFSYLIARFVFGKEHPATPFLLLLAIADDALGLIVLAAFYPVEPVRPLWLALSALAVGAGTAPAPGPRAELLVVPGRAGRALVARVRAVGAAPGARAAADHPNAAARARGGEAALGGHAADGHARPFRGFLEAAGGGHSRRIRTAERRGAARRGGRRHLDRAPGAARGQADWDFFSGLAWGRNCCGWNFRRASARASSSSSAARRGSGSPWRCSWRRWRSRRARCRTPRRSARWPRVRPRPSRSPPRGCWGCGGGRVSCGDVAAKLRAIRAEANESLARVCGQRIIRAPSRVERRPMNGE